MPSSRKTSQDPDLLYATRGDGQCGFDQGIFGGLITNKELPGDRAPPSEVFRKLIGTPSWFRGAEWPSLTRVDSLDSTASLELRPRLSRGEVCSTLPSAEGLAKGTRPGYRVALAVGAVNSTAGYGVSGLSRMMLSGRICQCQLKCQQVPQLIVGRIITGIGTSHPKAPCLACLDNGPTRRRDQDGYHPYEVRPPFRVTFPSLFSQLTDIGEARKSFAVATSEVI